MTTMVKAQVNLSIDADVVLHLKTLDVNVSGIVNDFLKNYCNIKENKSEKFSEIKKEELKAEAELAKIKNKKLTYITAIREKEKGNLMLDEHTGRLRPQTDKELGLE